MTQATNIIWPIVQNDLSYVAEYWNHTGFGEIGPPRSIFKAKEARPMGRSKRFVLFYSCSPASRSCGRQQVCQPSRLILSILRLASASDSLLLTVLLDGILYTGQFWRWSIWKGCQYFAGLASHVQSRGRMR